MPAKIFHHSLVIKEIHLDTFGHVNNAMYLTLLEDIRWDIISSQGFGINNIKETGIGPTILEIDIKFSKELRLREKVMVETQLLSYEKKIGKLIQKIIRDGEVCCTAELTLGLFSLKERKLVLPTPEWLQALGIES